MKNANSENNVGNVPVPDISSVHQALHHALHSSKVSEVDIVQIEEETEEDNIMEDILYEMSEEYSQTRTPETFINHSQGNSDIIIKSITSELNTNDSTDAQQIFTNILED